MASHSVQAPAACMSPPVLRSGRVEGNCVQPPASAPTPGQLLGRLQEATRHQHSVDGLNSLIRSVLLGEGKRGIQISCGSQCIGFPLSDFFNPYPLIKADLSRLDILACLCA